MAIELLFMLSHAEIDRVKDMEHFRDRDRDAGGGELQLVRPVLDER